VPFPHFLYLLVVSPVPPCVRGLAHSLQPGEARIADEREKGLNSNLVIFIFIIPFPKEGFFSSRSFPNIGLSI